MQFLAPLGLLGLLGVPLLIWLWRLSATRRQTVVSSLIPFEHLLRRQPRRRTNLVVNWLFWLQLAALVLLAAALAQPVWLHPRGRLILVVLDTSASMEAALHGLTALDQAKHALRAEIQRKRPGDQWFLISSAPVEALTPQPTSDGSALLHAVQSARATHLAGSLATAARIGRALAGAIPDEILLVSNETPPEGALGEGVRYLPVGGAVPNVALVGLDAQGPLCQAAESRLLATVQNFSDEPVEATLTASREGHRLVQVKQTLEAQARRAVLLALPPETAGRIDVRVEASPDGLAVDDLASIEMRPKAVLPVVVRSDRPALMSTVGAWLGACQALSWSRTPPEQGPYLAVTDGASDPAASGELRVVAGSSARNVLSHWMASPDHPVSAYLPGMDVVSAAISDAPVDGVPVIEGIVGGRKFPVVSADERDGRRVVSLLADPAGQRDSVPLLLVFFNSLRWLMGGADAVRVGEPITLGGWQAGSVLVHRPDGDTQTVPVSSRVLRYDATTRAGWYRLTQGGTTLAVAVNFFDPVESDTMTRVSTWRPLPPSAAMAAAKLMRHPLTTFLLGLVLALLLAEWWLYSRRAPGLVVPPSTGNAP